MAVGLAQQLDIDHLWIMDDDVLPEPDCLEKLLAQMDKTGAKVALPSREDENYTDRVCLDLDLEDHNKFWASLRKQVAPHPLDKEAYFVKDMTFEGPLMTLDISKKLVSQIKITLSSLMIQITLTVYHNTQNLFMSQMPS